MSIGAVESLAAWAPERRQCEITLVAVRKAVLPAVGPVVDVMDVDEA